MSFSDLPILFDLTQPHACNVSKDYSKCTCYEAEVQEKPKPLEPDKRLVNWEEWIERRKSVHEKLGKELERDPGDLVMNTAEEYRAVKEEKAAFEYTNIEEPDPQRGCPSFWNLPPALKSDCGDGTYFSVEKKEDRCEVPIIEHVGLPCLVLEEKDVMPRKRNSEALWKNLPYVQEKSLELADKMEKIVPHKPDFSQLFIKGNAIGKTDVDLSKFQKRQSLRFSKVSDDIDGASTKTKSTLGLTINDLHLSPDLEMSGTRKVYVFFEYDKTDGSLATEHVTLTNLGSCSLHYSWRPSPKHRFFKNIITDTTCQVYFYFNKNDGIILPGQTIEFPIWFKTEEPGTYYEQWEIYTKPSVTPPNTSVLIVFYATAMFGDIDEKVERIKEQLDKSIRDRFLSEMLSGITSNIPENKFKPIVYTYNKKEVFESINSSFDPVNRYPRYVYDRDVVKELQKFYKKVKRPSDPKTWNYHIEELKLLTRAKQRQEELLRADLKREESNRIYAARPKRKELSLNKSSCSKNADSKHKIAASSEHINPPDAFQDKSLTKELDGILSKLKSTGGHENVEQIKYSKAYHIFCTYINKIEDELEDLKNRLGIIKKTRYPKILIDRAPQFYCKPTRLVYEELDEILQRPSLLCRGDTSADKPVAEILKDIPINESKRRFKTYYGIPDSPVPGSSKKGTPSKSGSKSTKQSSKSTKPSSKSTKSESKQSKTGKKKESKTNLDEDDKYVVNEKFDPYLKIDLPELIPPPIEDEKEGEDKSMESNLDQVSNTVRCQYNYSLYVIMYTYLDQAVTNIIDMLDMQPKENLPYSVIREFEEPKYIRRLIDLKSIIAEENAECLKAKLVLWKYRKQCKKDWKSIEIQRQLKNVKSDTSLWSILRPYKSQLKLPEEKPISYPVDHYGDIKEKEHDFDVDRVNISTSSLGGGVIDDTWEDYKEVSQQKDYDAEDQEDDLEEYIEKVVSEISAQEIDSDSKMDKATQKRSSEHISDEEYFYDSDTDIDEDFISESEEPCSCEGIACLSCCHDEESTTNSSNKHFN